VPVRIHTFTGQVWAVKRGVVRMLLRYLDTILAANATHVLADSDSQRLFLIKNKVVGEDAIAVLADGSIAGVNLERFQFDSVMREKLRTEMGIAHDAVVFLFLGRLNRDKGLPDLLEAFALAASQDRSIHLAVVGPDEGGFERTLAALAHRFQGRVHRAGFSVAPENFLSAADVFCNPSYREGFGVVLIEAGAAGLPSLASRIYGITDAVVDGVTGILHTPACPAEIAEAMLLLASNRSMRSQMGLAARSRVVEKFSAARVTEAFAVFHRSVLAAGDQ
jgi:glycosyltransferase involved in cell wall biosynthesis